MSDFPLRELSPRHPPVFSRHRQGRAPNSLNLQYAPLNCPSTEHGPKTSPSSEDSAQGATTGFLSQPCENPGPDLQSPLLGRCRCTLNACEQEALDGEGRDEPDTPCSGLECEVQCQEHGPESSEGLEDMGLFAMLLTIWIALCSVAVFWLKVIPLVLHIVRLMYISLLK
ncbi:hypothetical protein AK830_g6968 [Neonectria ditissima]|uniref:Uncharacterized protein n=1 Tax=Neonectria ditissima TaxID=78410 RepID=A0A0P7BGJ2_9HYPO|nr:hypothetical protein AK830_g6968 [Neonectria ditissima]